MAEHTEPIAAALGIIKPYSVRRVPLAMIFAGEPVASIVHTEDREAVLSDPGGPEVDVERTELAERAA